VQLVELVEAYTVRQMFLAQLQAAMLMKIVAQAMGNGAGGDVVPPAEMLSLMGVDLGAEIGGKIS